VSSLCLGKQRHTTHLPEIEVFYRFHPLYGKKIQVLGTIQHQKELHYAIALPDGTRTYLPSWMAQPQAGFLSIREAPVISFNALWKLKEIVDASLQILHHIQRKLDDGGENAHKMRTAVGSVLPDTGQTDQDSTKSKPKASEPPCQFDGRNMDGQKIRFPGRPE